MIFPFNDNNEERTEELPLVKEYEIDFEKRTLTGRMVEGNEAVKMWVWLALHTPRYRYYIYSWDYGSEYEEMIGKGYSREYTESEFERMTEECLLVNPCITGIDNFSADFNGNTVTLSFTIYTIYGEEEFVTDV